MSESKTKAKWLMDTNSLLKRLKTDPEFAKKAKDAFAEELKNREVRRVSGVSEVVKGESKKEVPGLEESIDPLDLLGPAEIKAGAAVAKAGIPPVLFKQLLKKRLPYESFVKEAYSIPAKNVVAGGVREESIKASKTAAEKMAADWRKIPGNTEEDIQRGINRMVADSTPSKIEAKLQSGAFSDDIGGATNPSTGKAFANVPQAVPHEGLHALVYHAKKKQPNILVNIQKITEKNPRFNELLVKDIKASGYSEGDIIEEIPAHIQDILTNQARRDSFYNRQFGKGTSQFIRDNKSLINQALRSGDMSRLPLSVKEALDWQSEAKKVWKDIVRYTEGKH